MNSKKTIFITGAGRGLGNRMAREALALGHNVVATGRTTGSVSSALGTHDHLLVVALDVTNEAQAKEAAAAAVSRFGRIDVLINNAGFGLLGAVEEATAQEIEKLYATNVFGLLKVTRAVLPYMRRERAGHVINISSIGGYRCGAGFGVYCSTKFAVEGLSEALHAELSALNIHVTVVEPGYFRTDFLDARSLSVSPSRIADYDSTAGAVRTFAGEYSHNQPGDPDKLAKRMMELIAMQEPPLRMPFGSDTLAAIQAKNEFVASELDRLRSFAISTDFETAR